MILSSERVIVVGHQPVTQNLRGRDGVLGCDHRSLLTNQSDQDRHKRGAGHSHKHDEVKPRHLGVAKRAFAD